MNPNKITIHYSATRPEWMQGRPLADKITEIRRWHMGRGWKQEGYHIFIDRDGLEGEGRPLWMQGAHVGGHNTDNIGICVLGGHGGQADGKFSDNFTAAQEKKLIEVIKRLQKQFNIPDSMVKGHNNYAATSCPGCDIPTWWKSAKGVPVISAPRIPNRKRSLGEILAGLFAAIFGKRN